MTLTPSQRVDAFLRSLITHLYARLYAWRERRGAVLAKRSSFSGG